MQGVARDTSRMKVAEPRKPRIALMGEFSAGKSTLANLLLERDVSPVKVTATQMPPIWYAKGTPRASVVQRNGKEFPITLDGLGAVSLANTMAIRVFLEAEVLDFCDLIDMPGTSDPNMVHDAWEGILAQAEGVVWCTSATQAWRQSEAAIWEQMPPELWDKSLLLVTRMDKLVTERDRARVVSRVRREAGEFFRGVYPISLTEAFAARDDDDLLRHSGTEAFVDALIALVEEMDEGAAKPVAPAAVVRDDAEDEEFAFADAATDDDDDFDGFGPVDEEDPFAEYGIELEDDTAAQFDDDADEAFDEDGADDGDERFDEEFDSAAAEEAGEPEVVHAAEAPRATPAQDDEADLLARLAAVKGDPEEVQSDEEAEDEDASLFAADGDEDDTPYELDPATRSKSGGVSADFNLDDFPEIRNLFQ
ncbi:dynamin family protein [Pseudooceanicola sp. LIPI14-2-Ac024]|uniref:dynamin family protein n=1 Tax=Pseudooceanicola sp. LIPI14-2-Ac024 TaxID=3344875 RepID=UPI0035D12B77